MRLFAVRSKMVRRGDDLVQVILASMRKQKLALKNNDILALTSKIVAYAEGRIVNLRAVKPSQEAGELAEKFSLRPEFAELVLREAMKVYGGVDNAVLTLRDGMLAANAGIDNKNAPANHVVLWPRAPERWAKRIREEIRLRTRKQVGVLIVDSGLIPLRVGTVGLAMAVAGFKPIRDRRGERDLYGKPLMITRQAVADDLASAAHLLMGEVSEKTPIVLIRDAPVDLDDGAYGPADMAISPKECIYMGALCHT